MEREMQGVAFETLFRLTRNRRRFSFWGLIQFEKGSSTPELASLSP